MIEPAVKINATLPSTWIVAAIDDVTTISPKSCADDVNHDDPVHFIPMAAVSENFGGIDISQLRPYGEVRKGYTSFSEGDVLLAKITPCMENGKGGLVPSLSYTYAFGSTEFHVLRPTHALLPKWLAHYLSQPDFRKTARQNMTGTAGQMRVPSRWLAEIGIPLAPIDEQTRIIEKLEELLSDLDAGVAELKAAQAKLVRYRQSLLKAAVEGALTAEWRQHNTTEETGTQLLQRILTERRARWEAKQLAKFAEQGKAPPKDWQKKYPEPAQPDTRDLPELPEGWVWASLDQLTEFITSGSRGWADYYSAQGAIFIRSQNINKDRLDLSDTAFVTPPRNNDGIRASVQKHDLLLTITGANVGKTACVEITLNEAYVSQHVALIRLVEATLDNFIHLYLTSSSGGRGQLDKEAYGAGKPGLNLQQVGSVHIPLPGRAEVSALMAILKTQLEAMSEQKQSIDGLLKQSNAQRKNILRAAFSGQLVPQDPSDEPASALLARIRAGRVMSQQTEKKSRATIRGARNAR